MRHSFRLAFAAFVSGLAGLLVTPHAAAQVYQCLDASGKKVFSQLPCAAQGGNNERLIMRAPGTVNATAAPVNNAAPAKGGPGALQGNDAAPAPKDWAAENTAANARANAVSSNAGSSQVQAPLGGLRKGSTSTPGPSDQQIIAGCEANRGARCSSAGEIAQRRMEQRELTPSERQQQQRAVSNRLQREREEAFERSMRR